LQNYRREARGRLDAWTAEKAARAVTLA
jgi:hypothetical protein